MNNPYYDQFPAPTDIEEMRVQADREAMIVYLAWEEAHRDQRAVFWIETKSQVFWH